MDILITLAFLAIIASLATALFFMLRGGQTGDETPEQHAQRTAGKRNSGMARALAVRVGVSVVLFICVLVSWKMGWITPTGLPVGK